MFKNWKKLPRTVWLLAGASLFTDIASDSVYPLLPIYLATTLGASPIALGLIEGIAEATASLLKFFSGWWSDRTGKKKPFVVLGYSLSTISKPLLGVVQSWPQALLIRFLDRFGKGVRTAPRDAWLARTTSHELYPEVYAIHRAFDHTGAIIGPLLATLYLSFYPGEYRTLFLLTIIPGIIAVLLLLPNPELEFPKKEKIPWVNPWNSWRLLPQNVRRYIVCLGIFSLANSTDAFLILRLKEVGISETVIPVLWALLHVVKMLSSLISPWILNKFGMRRTILLGWSFYAWVYLAFPFVTGHAASTALFLLYGLFFGLTEGPERAFLAKLTGEGQRGSAFGIHAMTVAMSVLPASLLFGGLWKVYSMTYAFMVASAIAFFASLLFIFRVKEVNFGKSES